MQTRSHLTGNGAKILGAIQAGKSHNKDIAMDLKVTQAAVSQSLTRLREGGFVRKLKNGELLLAEAHNLPIDYAAKVAIQT